jgi:ribosomal protein S18 acetylase RimI-like enzyme
VAHPAAVAVRKAVPSDGGRAAALILEPAPSLAEVLGSREAGLRAARASFLARRSIHSHRFALVAEMEGRVVGLAVAVPGRMWRRLRIRTGLTLLLAAPARGPWLVRRGRVLDRLIAPVPPDSLYVSSLAAAEEVRSRGIGAELMRRVEAGAAEQGLRSVTLDVGLENERARAFYERLGYREAGRTPARERDRRLVPTTGSARMEKAVTGG